MQHHIILKRSFFFFLLLLTNWQLAQAEVSRLRCMWRTDPTTSMVVGWDQLTGSNPTFYYSTNQLTGQSFESYAQARVPDKVLYTKGMNNHFVRLSGLTPDTRYYFKIVDSQGSSKTYSFRTAPASPYTRLSIIAGGDSRNHRAGRVNANKLVGKLKPHFVLFGGDMTGADNDKQWLAWFDDWQHTITEEGQLTPIIVTRGNHEYSNKTLIDLFDVATIDLFYAFSFGTDLLRVYTLNSLIPSGGKQVAWLKKDLQQNSQVQWKIAQYHHSIRPHTKVKKEKHEQLLHWSPLFYKHQVQLVVESDAHVVKTTYPIKPSNEADSHEGFVREDQRGTIYVGEGCWGAPLRENNDNKPWTRASGSFNQFKWIFIDQSGMEVRTIKTDNASFVPSVNLASRFYPPVELNIWAPKGESVIYIHNRNKYGSPVSYTTSARTITNPLIVKDFSSTTEGQDIALKWLVQSEPLNTNFEVQRSINDEKYVTIAKMQGKSHISNTNPSYQFRDTGLAIRAQGQYIKYRIKYRTPNGQTGYYHPPIPELTTTNANPSQKSLQTDPKGRVRIKYELKEDAAVIFQLFHAKSKKEVFHNQLINQPAKNYLKSLDISQLPNGTYVLVVKANKDEIERFEVVKQ